MQQFDELAQDCSNSIANALEFGIGYALFVNDMVIN